ncbi:MAG: aldehyde ferredoxin oxidoreductase [Gammaproteobacteria bacterium]|nr:aldehyde ferredoxin oxidoreductase [Gammaproteobacteria bacterium]MCP5199865.1 aldehyde ferredoxin oxidoreductase [Gammaproteobacteria bacterium]
MRQYLHIDLPNRDIRREEFSGEQVARAGRYFIARTLNELGTAGVDPLGPDNPLIFSAGPFAGSNFSNANRTSVGCKSPLTGGIKEANAGGSFGLALGQLEIAGFTLYGVSDEWVVIHLRQDGSVDWADATPYLGLGNFECAEKLHAVYGNKVSLAICSPVGEWGGLLAGISMSDTDRRPSRLAARGGVGAVMGSKKVKAVVVDLLKMPNFHDRKALLKGIKEYGQLLRADDAVNAMRNYGTAMVADYTNHIGGLPVNNFSSGSQGLPADGVFKMGGEHIRERNLARGGIASHACMPGCMIECSNVYADEDGKEIASPVEYETLGLMGTNCGLTDPDDLARLNWHANDLGIDTIETGAMMGVLLDAGLAGFGDVDFLHSVLDAIRAGSEQGRLWAQGTARVGAHYGVARTPVIKRQGISAYDPRVIEVTGISMMVTAQGADHTTGNAFKYECSGKDIDELVGVSMDMQTVCATADSLGLCVFGRSVTNVNTELVVKLINDAMGTELPHEFFFELGRETLRLEAQFNRDAGFTEDDDELPEFFYREPLSPSDKVARFHAAEVNAAVRRWWAQHVA